METNEKNVYDVLEPEENIIWQGISSNSFLGLMHK